MPDLTHEKNRNEEVAQVNQVKKIAMFTMGTRGDIQPYIDLSQALRKNGYCVILGSHPCWKNLIESYSINFVPIGPDIDIDKEAAIIRGKTKNPALSMLKTMNFVFDIIVSSSEDVFEVCKGRDLIIVSHAQMGATEAEVLGIPTINVTLQTEMIPQTLKKQSLFESLCGKMIAGQIAKPYNRIRKKYKLKPIKDIGRKLMDTSSRKKISFPLYKKWIYIILKESKGFTHYQKRLGKRMDWGMR